MYTRTLSTGRVGVVLGDGSGEDMVAAVRRNRKGTDEANTIRTRSQHDEEDVSYRQWAEVV